MAATSITGSSGDDRAVALVRIIRAVALAGVVICAAMPARAEWLAVYDAYVAGANAVRLTARFKVNPATYQVSVQARTLGLLDVFVGSRQDTRVDGIFHGPLPRPRQFHAEGMWKGERRHTLIDYHDGHPSIRSLLPVEQARDPVPPAIRHNALDRLSPLAQLAQHVARTGGCDTNATTYDGRRLEETRARTGGWEELPPSNVSSFAGRALRCDIELRQTAGFTQSEDRAHAGRLRHAQVWIAQPGPGAPMLPIRIALDIGWLGRAMVYLAEFRATAP